LLITKIILHEKLFSNQARLVGGFTRQVPIEIGSTQVKAFSIRWLLGASRKHSG